uniref:Uncharacterized protein n=1 Tax=Opuntia streptacantha TaxID=393608 RepID=A0A7C9AGD4_OPUST
MTTFGINYGSSKASKWFKSSIFLARYYSAFASNCCSILRLKSIDNWPPETWFLSQTLPEYQTPELRPHIFLRTLHNPSQQRPLLGSSYYHLSSSIHSHN